MTLANLIAVMAIALSAMASGWAARRIGIPDFLGFIVAGAVVGAVGPEFLPTNALDQDVLDEVAALGLISLMVTTGHGMSAHLGLRRWKEVAVLSTGIVLCIIPAFATAPTLMRLWPDPVMAEGAAAAAAYRCALALAVIVTSVPFITKVLAHNGLLGTPFAATVLCTACCVDLVVWALVPVIVAYKAGGSMDVGAALAPVGATCALLAGATAIVMVATRSTSGMTEGGRGRWAAHGHVLAGVLLALLSLVFVTAAGVSVMVGALVLGLAVGRLRLPPTRRGAWSVRTASLLLVPSYFAIVGLRLRLGADVQFGLIITFILWSTLIKTIVVVGLAAMLRYRMREVVALGFALNTRGGPGIVLATVAFGAGIIGEPTFIALISASIATALMADWALRLTIAERRGSAEARTGWSTRGGSMASSPPVR